MEFAIGTDGQSVEQWPGADAAVISVTPLGGLHYRYAWRQAA